MKCISKKLMDLFPLGDGFIVLTLKSLRAVMQCAVLEKTAYNGRWTRDAAG
jgi:hypothetical protein